ncbi:DUF5696 domain-containing protein [Paenibacillus sp. sgz302251]|uniref:DUF5696 domain-containing protein n=1 Tax=Paenibacillus sp. sgz302251 TaxID=3414493 RepID=UPI003C7C995C
MRPIKQIKGIKRLKGMLLAVTVVLVLFSGKATPIQADEEDTKKTESSGWGSLIDGGDSSGGKTSASSQLAVTKLMAENTRFKLFVDEKVGQLRLEDKKTRKQWLGAPGESIELASSNLKFVQAPVHIRYTEGTSNTQTYPSKEQGTKVTMTAIDNGARFTFDVPAIKIAFVVEYKLVDTGLEVNVPFDSIKEKGAARLTSLELLPFFDAAGGDEEGALFVPDGSGALIKFQKEHPKYFNGYSEFVYGADPTYLHKVNEEVRDWVTRAPSPKESVALPVYGIYKKDQGFLAVVTGGEHDAKINATPSGVKNINLYRSSAEFLYRNDDVIFIGNSGEIPIYQGNMIKGDRTVRFMLVSEDQANYVGLASAYRDYLTKEKGLKPNPQQEVPFQLRLFGGVLRDEIIGKTFVKMTTFDQAKQMIDAFAAQGIVKMEVTFEGWSGGGQFGNQPNHFPASRKLGGTKGLKELAAYAKSKGVALYLSANYVRPYSQSDDVRASKDAVRGLDRNVLRVNNYYLATRFSIFREKFYLLKANRVFKRYIQHEVDEFTKAGVAGVHYDYMGELLYSDQDSKNLADRSQTAGVWVKAMDLMREKNGKVAVDYGFAYTFGHVDRIDDIPLDSSHFTYESETVPFFQIAIHGLIPYTAAPSNLQDDPRIGLLRSLEYGASPSYIMTHEPTNKLKRTMADVLFSTDYSKLMQPSVSEYKEVSSILNKVADQPIVNHEQFAPRLYKTTYGNGTEIIVNYNDKPADVDGTTVQAYGFTVKEGENPT